MSGRNRFLPAETQPWYLFVGVWKQTAERGVPVHGESSGGRVRVPASSAVVVPHVADAACHSDAAARRRRLSADRDDGRRHVSARNHPMSQRPAEGISPSLKPACRSDGSSNPIHSPFRQMLYLLECIPVPLVLTLSQTL